MLQASLKEPDVHQHEWEIVLLGRLPIGVGCECGTVLPVTDPGEDVDTLHFEPGRVVKVVGLSSLGGKTMVYLDVQISAQMGAGTQMVVTLGEAASLMQGARFTNTSATGS